MKKRIAAGMAAIMAASLMAGAVSVQAEEPVKITFYSTQAGLDNETVELLNAFTEETGIETEYLPCGEDQLQAWLGLYAANKAPTVSLLDSTVIQQLSLIHI